MISDGLELVIEWGNGNRLAAPFPLPPATPTPCEFVARIGELTTLSPDRWSATWWVQPRIRPGEERKPAAPEPRSALTSGGDPTEDSPCPTEPDTPSRPSASP